MTDHLELLLEQLEEEQERDCALTAGETPTPHASLWEKQVPGDENDKGRTPASPWGKQVSDDPSDGARFSRVGGALPQSAAAESAAYTGRDSAAAGGDLFAPGTRDAGGTGAPASASPRATRPSGEPGELLAQAVESVQDALDRGGYAVSLWGGLAAAPPGDILTAYRAEGGVSGAGVSGGSASGGSVFGGTASGGSVFRGTASGGSLSRRTVSGGTASGGNVFGGSAAALARRLALSAVQPPAVYRTREDGAQGDLAGSDLNLEELDRQIRQDARRYDGALTPY